MINTAQNFFVKANLNLVRKGDRLNFKIMFRSGFRELEDDPFFRLVKNVVKILECSTVCGPWSACKSH